jgi:hypothetical protein
MKNKECFYSSFLFLINMIISCLYKKYDYSIYFLILTITSLIHHYFYNRLTFIIDRIIIIIIMYKVMKCVYDKFNIDKVFKNIAIFLSFFYILFIYYAGYCYKKLCYDLNDRVANLWHSSLHLVAFMLLNIPFVY